MAWSGFSADPRDPRFAPFRASDRDRSLTYTMLADAYADGRLDHAEYDARLAAAAKIRTLGEIMPLLRDLVIPGPASIEVHEKAGHRTRKVAFTVWAVINAFLVTIWLLAGGPGTYFWPMWPMLGTALPAVAMTLIAENTYERAGRPVKRRPVPPAPPRAELGQLPGPIETVTGRRRRRRR